MNPVSSDETPTPHTDGLSILACPFCGSDGEIVKHATGWRAHCVNPMCQVSINECSSRAAAQRIWNRRSNGRSRASTTELEQALDQAVRLIDMPDFKRDQLWHMGRDVVLHVWDKWCNKRPVSSASTESTDVRENKTNEGQGDASWMSEKSTGHLSNDGLKVQTSNPSKTNVVGPPTKEEAEKNL